MSSARADARSLITLRNATCPDKPLAITSPVAIVAALDFSQAPSRIDAQCVLVARSLHQLISEQFPQSTLRFVARDVPQYGGRDAPMPAWCQRQLSEDCARLSIAAPELSLRSSVVRAQSEAAIREMIDDQSLVRTDQFSDAQSFDLNRDLWAQRSQERSWALPATIPPFTSGRIAARYRDEWSIDDAFTAVDLCTIARNDGLPIVLLWSTHYRIDELTVSAAAELRNFAQPIACLPVSVGSIRNNPVPEFIDALMRDNDPRHVRHWFLCGSSRRKQVPLRVERRWITDHFRTCSQRVSRVLELREEARAMIALDAEPIRAPSELLVELDRWHSEFVHTLRTEFNVDGASQLLARVCKLLARRLRDQQRDGLRETLAVVESMASTVGIL